MRDESKKIGEKILELHEYINCSIQEMEPLCVNSLMDDNCRKLVNICIDDKFVGIRNYFKYSKDDINKKIEDFKLQEVCMSGTHKELSQLKKLIEFVYSQYIFYLSYWKEECGYHGWNWTEDDGSLKNQANITDGITERFKEIYALILSGLGQKCE